MTSLLIIIYLSFISLGLPDSVLGAAWPTMHTCFMVPIQYGGYIGMATSLCTVISSLAAVWLHKKLGTEKTIAFSTLLTAVALLGYSFTRNYFLLFPFAIVLGLGGGAIDSALNNYVALHYEARHMSFLHTCWGIGATVGPLIISGAIVHKTWRTGYQIIALLQLILTAVQFMSFPLWRKKKVSALNEAAEFHGTANRKTVPLAMLSFFFYCAYETTCIVWIATYFVKELGTSAAAGARASSAFFLGISAGRIISGVISDKVGVKRMIYFSAVIALLSSILLHLTNSAAVSFIAVLLIGLGCAAIYPSMIHRTPRRYGSESSPKIIGFQMATAYIGSTAIPPLMGNLAVRFSFKLIPVLGIISMSAVLVFTWIIEQSNTVK